MKRIAAVVLFLCALRVIGFSQSEEWICYNLFRSSDDITDLGKEAVSGAAQAVWAASELNGGNLTLTGTISQTAPGSDIWTYSASPSDKLVVVFASGPTLEFTFTTFNGYFSGTWEDFVNSHSLDFTVTWSSVLDLHIISTANPVSGATIWQRQIQGTTNYQGTQWTLNINHSGKDSSTVDANFAYREYSESVSGTSSVAGVSVNINETYWSVYVYSNISPPARWTFNKWITTNSSATVGSDTYQFQNAQVRWAGSTRYPDSVDAGHYNEAIDSEYWLAGGTMQKNGTHFGNVVFSGPVVSGTYGPLLILFTNDSRKILLHSLLQWWVTDVQENYTGVPSTITLFQNYPNPFNPVTEVRYQLSEVSNVTLKIYDVLGREIATLVDEVKQPGFYQVQWDATNVPSGVYFSTIKAGTVVQTQKMMLMK